MGDKEFVDRLRRREPQAISELYSRFGGLVFSAIHAIVRDRSITEDLVQDTFIRVWNGAHAFEQDRGSVGHWILIIARNRAIDHSRSLHDRVRRRAVGLSQTHVPCYRRDPESHLADVEQARLLHQAIAKLGGRQRQVIHMAYFEGLTQVEIAERLAQPLGTVKAWTRSALSQLRAIQSYRA